MNVAVYLPFLAAAGIGAVAPTVARMARPATGALLLAVLLLVASIGSTWSLVLLASTLADDVWPGPEAPVPDPVAGLSVVVLALIAVRYAALAVRRIRAERQVRGALISDASLVVVADSRPDAFAVPPRWHPRPGRRRPGQVVVTSEMIAVLDEHQRRAMVAHEQAHLDGHHHRLRAAAEGAAALNPLLIPARRTVAYLCERAADERAALAVGDRRIVATAVAAAAMARSASVQGRSRVATRSGALAFDELGVVERVVALGRPAPRRRVLVAAAALAVAVAIVATDAHATGECVRIIQSLLPN
jgi:Zn-dependent protease with chaperone function